MSSDKKYTFGYFILAVIAAILSSCITPSILVTREQNTGDALYNNHSYREAIVHYKKMLDASSRLGIYRNPEMESAVCRKIAGASELIGRYDEAMLFINKAHQIDSASNNIQGRIEDYTLEGSLWVYMGSYYKGIKSLERSLALSEGMDQSIKNTRRLSIASTYLALGQLYTVMGRGSDAEEYIAKAYSIYIQAADRRGEMESLLASGMLKADRGDIDEARNDAMKSLAIASDLKMSTSRQNQLLGSLSLSSGGYEDAVRYQSLALEDARRTGIVAQIIWASIGMGDIYTALGDSKRAAQYYQKAGEVRDTMQSQAGSLDASLGLRTGDLVSANRYFTSQGSLTGKAVSDMRIADNLAARGSTDSALLFISEATSAFKSASNMQGLANARVFESRLLHRKGRLDEAMRSADSALRASAFPETVWQALYIKGRIYESQEKKSEAVESYLDAVSVIEKMRGNLTVDEFKSTFFDSKREVYDRLITLLMEKDDPVAAFRMSEQARARAFYDILANRKIDYRGSVPGDLISLEQEKRLEMQKLFKLLQQSESSAGSNVLTRGTELNQIRDNLTRVQEEYEELLRKIKLNNPSYAEMVSADPVNLKELQQNLGIGKAVLEYWISDNSLIIWLIKPESVTGRSIPISKTELTSLIENSRLSIRSNSTPEYKNQLSALYNVLVSPFSPLLSNVSDLIIIPNGSLHFLPFQALINHEGRYLAEEFNIIYSPSASVYNLTCKRPVSEGSRFMGFALADIMIDNKPGLPGTADELNRITPLFSEKVTWKGHEGTESLVKLHSGQSNIIHFATHGSYNYRQPLYSYLLFPPDNNDDGHLNVYEVLEMNLNSKLVTLSACETGLGNLSNGDELTGLSRAFLFAGSSSVVVSLWAVADYPTALLMTKFYTYLNKHPVQEALTLAQRDVIKVFPSPQYWSPFILIGNGDVTIN